MTGPGRWPRPRSGSARGVFARHFFEPRDARICAVIRIGVSLCLLINLLVLGKDLQLWFSEQGVLPLQAAFAIVDPDTLPVFRWFPTSWPLIKALYLLAVLQTLLLLLGFRARFQAICLFAWLVVFQYRNLLLLDGGDTVFRLLTFFLALMPSGAAFSVDAWLARRRGQPLAIVRPIWALPLVQIEMTLIYVSTAWEKLRGDDWISGNALYYVSRLDDNFGQSAIASFLFQYLFVCKLVSRLVLAFEILLPITLWIKATRRLALAAGILFHLMLDNVMHLFLFEWVMIAGLLSFLSADDLTWLQGLAARLSRRSRGRRRRPADQPAPASG